MSEVRYQLSKSQGKLARIAFEVLHNAKQAAEVVFGQMVQPILDEQGIDPKAESYFTDDPTAASGVAIVVRTPDIQPAAESQPAEPVAVIEGEGAEAL